MKVWLAFWPSQWQAATDNETVIDLVFGVYSTRDMAVESVRGSMTLDEWEAYHEEFVYEELEVDEYHPIPHV
jgi:hypothetical protein